MAGKPRVQNSLHALRPPIAVLDVYGNQRLLIPANFSLNHCAEGTRNPPAWLYAAR